MIEQDMDGEPVPEWKQATLSASDLEQYLLDLIEAEERGR